VVRPRSRPMMRRVRDWKSRNHAERALPLPSVCPRLVRSTGEAPRKYEEKTNVELLRTITPRRLLIIRTHCQLNRCPPSNPLWTRSRSRSKSLSKQQHEKWMWTKIMTTTARMKGEQQPPPRQRPQQARRQRTARSMVRP
jgi:hypothetical protein